MSTYTNLLFHVIYSTKYRKPTIDAAWQDELYGYIGGILRANRGVLLKAGGIEDHIHLLAKLPPTIAVSNMLRLMKANSSKWINEEKKPKKNLSGNLATRLFRLASHRLEPWSRTSRINASIIKRGPFKRSSCGF